MITIYDIHGDEIVSVEPCNGSRRVYTLMSEDYVQLKFSLAEAIQLPLGCYIVTEQYGRFELSQRTYPKLNAKTGGWDYDIRFDAEYLKWRNKIFKYVVENGNNETSWSLTAQLNVHVEMLLRNLEALGYTFEGEDYVKDIGNSVTTEAKCITYENRTIYEALQDMAEAFECEFWITDKTIHFGRCESGEPIEFRQGVNVQQMSAEGTRQQYATRLYAFGSTRNLPKTYRPTTPDITINGVVQKRLMLPADTPYIDSEPNLDVVQAVEQVVVFDDVYPRTQSTISGVSTVQYDEQGEDGQPNGKTWNAYRFRIPTLPFSESFLLPDTDLQAVFQSGRLSGMTFNIKFNPEGVDEGSPQAQVFEIIRNEDYGRPIPDEYLYPQDGDKVVLIGWDVTKIETLGLITAAEQELKQKAIQKVEKLKVDPANYRCQMISAAMFDQGGLWTPYDVGFRVTLYNDGCFEEGFRDSRIIGYEYDFSQPFKTPTYIVGEQAAAKRISELEAKVDALTIGGQTYTNGSGGNGSNVYVIKTNDRTPPSDSNVYSALNTRRKFLSRSENDTAAGMIDFLSGLRSQGLAKFLNEVHFGEFLSDMWMGYGGGIDARGNAEFESLRVRSVMEVMELVVNRLSAIEGDQLLTEADIIEQVTDLGGGRYTLKLVKKYDGYFTAQSEGAVLKGIVNNIYDAAISGETLSYYTSWMRVNMVNPAANTLEVTIYPDEQVPSGKNYAPCPMMRVARWGHQTDETRQTCIVLSTTERRILFYQHVTKPIIDPKVNIGMCLGKAPDWLKGKGYQIDDNQNYLYVKGVFTEHVNHVNVYGEPICEYVNRGPWQQGEHYCFKHKNPDTDIWEISLVYHRGCQWQCMVDGTEAEPSVYTTDWVMVVGNQKFVIDFEEPYRLYELQNFDTTLTVKAYIGDFDVTEQLQDANIGWTRYTEDKDGNPRLASDTIWTNNHGGSGKQLHLTTADLDIGSEGLPKKIIFTATAYYTDGVMAAAQYSI